MIFIPADMCCTIATRSFCASFRSALASDGVKTIVLPAKSPNLNAFAERWVRSVKQECLSKLILFGEVLCRGCLRSTAATITTKETIRAKAIGCSSLVAPAEDTRLAETLRVISDSAAYLSTTSAPHE